MMEEIWKFYNHPITTKIKTVEVSNYGNVKINGKLIDFSRKNTKGYYVVAGHHVHRMVAELFIPNPENKPCVDHINTNKYDNRVDNLRWVTYSENMHNKITYENNKSIQNSDKTKNAKSNSLKKYYQSNECKVKGKNNGMYGYKWSKEQKIQHSMKLKGKHRVYREDGSFYMSY